MDEELRTFLRGMEERLLARVEKSGTNLEERLLERVDRGGANLEGRLLERIERGGASLEERLLERIGEGFLRASRRQKPTCFAHSTDGRDLWKSANAAHQPSSPDSKSVWLSQKSASVNWNAEN